MYSYEMAYEIVDNFLTDIIVLCAIIVISIIFSLIILSELKTLKKYNIKQLFFLFLFLFLSLFLLIFIYMTKAIFLKVPLNMHYKDFRLLCKSLGLSVPEVLRIFLFSLI